MTGELFLTAPKIVLQKPLIVEIYEICKNDPPPIFCELPDELRLRPISLSSIPYATTVVTSGTTITSGTTTTT